MWICSCSLHTHVLVILPSKPEGSVVSLMVISVTLNFPSAGGVTFFDFFLLNVEFILPVSVWVKKKNEAMLPAV